MYFQKIGYKTSDFLAIDAAEAKEFSMFMHVDAKH